MLIAWLAACRVALTPAPFPTDFPSVADVRAPSAVGTATRPTAAATSAPTLALVVTPTVAAPATLTPTPVPAAPRCERTANPTQVGPGALGSPQAPIVISFVPGREPEAKQAAAAQLAACLSGITGLSYAARPADNYEAAVAALGAGRSQVALLDLFALLAAEQQYGVPPALAVLRRYQTNALDPDRGEVGRLLPYSRGQFIAKADSGVRMLQDLKGKSFCYVDPSSVAGFILPHIFLRAAGLNPDQDLGLVQYTYSAANTAVAVWLGDCAAGMIPMGVLTDPAFGLPQRFPGLADQVGPFADTDRIPNEGVTYGRTLDAAAARATTTALLAFAQDPGGLAVLRALMDADGLAAADRSYYDQFGRLLTRMGIDVRTLVQ